MSSCIEKTVQVCLELCSAFIYDLEVVMATLQVTPDSISCMLWLQSFRHGTYCGGKVLLGTRCHPLLRCAGKRGLACL